MFSIRACPLPEVALLNVYRDNGAHTDCYATDVTGTVTHEQLVAAFYTTRVFKLERLILKWAVARPSTDEQARQLAAGTIDVFAAWHVEKRGPDQLLLSDFQQRTRSWLMVSPIMLNGAKGTRLYFGSAVVPVRSARTGKVGMGAVFRALLGFHKLYSVVLLQAARARLTP